MKLKICGMKYPENIIEVAALQPDYMGFIFWEKSSRYFDGMILNYQNPSKKNMFCKTNQLQLLLKKVQK
jgi:phosphoribosylanthranilate isomerase